MQVTTIGLDLAKNVFQVNGVADAGSVAFNRSLRRGQVPTFFESVPPCLVGIEACGTSHYWAREIAKFGHKVRLIPLAYVKPYVKQGKSDAIDAAAICEAVTRPLMRFVAIKSPEQQAVLALHRVRDLIVRQRTQIVNMLRGVLAEFGIVVRQGAGHAIAFARQSLGGVEQDLPDLARNVVTNLCHLLVALHRRVLWYGRQLNRTASRDARVARLRTIPGVGPITRCDRCLDRGRASVLQRPQLRGLARPHTAQPIEWRQGTAGAHLEDGGPIHPAPARARHDLAD